MALFRKNDQALKPPGSSISAADAMRFAGAIPEVANSRYASPSPLVSLFTRDAYQLDVTARGRSK